MQAFTRAVVRASVITALAASCSGDRAAPAPASTAPVGLWGIYDQSLKHAKYIDLTHTITPAIPVWKGFGASTFGPTVNPATGKPYTYTSDGFEATDTGWRPTNSARNWTRRHTGRPSTRRSTSCRQRSRSVRWS